MNRLSKIALPLMREYVEKLTASNTIPRYTEEGQERLAKYLARELYQWTEEKRYSGKWRSFEEENPTKGENK